MLGRVKQNSSPPYSHAGGTVALLHSGFPSIVRMIKVISWNLLRLTGASLADLVGLIRRELPDLLLMQEATQAIDGMAEEVGGHYLRSPLPGRVHGLAAWSPVPFPGSAVVLPLPSGTMFDRICQVLDFGEFAVANVHLSHGQVLNRRQLRRLAEALPAARCRGGRLQPRRPRVASRIPRRGSARAHARGRRLGTASD